MKRPPASPILVFMASILFGCLAASAPLRASDAETVAFESQILPILQENCVECHNDNVQKGDVSLARRSAIIGGLDGLETVVHPGVPGTSLLIDVISGPKPDMPKKKDPLKPEQIELLRRWIQQGALWPENLVIQEASKADKSWWAYLPLQHTDPPAPDGNFPDWNQNPIDRFVLAALREQDLTPNPLSRPEDFIRRATYDLTGLPPSPEEIRAFAAAARADRRAATEELIDRLLASPHYGERWGRHWLDVVRFGESRGFERNVINDNIWPFRDYVVRSLNEDKPFDRFFVEHLAGDVVGKGDPAIEVATAFLVAGPYDDVGNQDVMQKKIIRANTLDDPITATGSAFLAMTINCARCHDHKFDPIAQADYYRVRAAFEGVEQGERVLAAEAAKKAHADALKPLNERKKVLVDERDTLEKAIVERTKSKADELLPKVTRPKMDRTFNEDVFEPVKAKMIRLTPFTNDTNPIAPGTVNLDEFEAWSADETPRNVALAANGGVAGGDSREVQDAKENAASAYSAVLTNDGKFGRRWISAGNHTLTITFARPETINRVVFSSDRPADLPKNGKMVCVGEYKLEVSLDGETWTEVSNSWDREPINAGFEKQRLLRFGTQPDEKKRLADLSKELAQVEAKIRAVPDLPVVWAGRFEQPKEATFLARGGDPNKPADAIVPGSLSTLSEVTDGYELSTDAPESLRRLQLAKWIVAPDNPLTPRVLANRIWHYHFGTGIVNTPSDFGYMGGKPSHPELLDWLALRLKAHDWKIKALHREIMLSQAYQQSADYREEAASKDSDSRLLWRFPPRRLSAEEIRDTMLTVAGKLDERMGGPGFRLYRFTQDNVCTYTPLDEHGPETYRRAVYHQNPRAAKLDLLTEFDCPDTAFAAPDRASTTTPLQALTLMNHRFTIDMARFFAERLSQEARTPADQARQAFLLAFGREPSAAEQQGAETLIQEHGLDAFCRALLNANELIYVN